MPIKVKGQTADRHPRRPWNSPERRRERQKEYMDKHGPQQPRRKRLATTDKYKDVRKILKDPAGFKPLRAAKATGGAAGRKGLTHKGKPTQTLRDQLKDASKRRRKGFFEYAGGSEKAKPHSTKEGRTAAGKRRVGRILEQLKPKTMEQRPLPKWPKQPKKIPATRNAYGLGGAIKKIIQKVVKPKGVFKPKGVGVKPVPKSVTDVDKPFKGYDKSYTRADDKKITSMLKKLGDEIKAQPIPHRIQKKIKELQKAYPHHDSAGRNKASKKVFKSAKGKAEGGRIGLSHGGSVGAAIRGRGAEIK